MLLWWPWDFPGWASMEVDHWSQYRYVWPMEQTSPATWENTSILHCPQTCWQIYLHPWKAVWRKIWVLLFFFFQKRFFFVIWALTQGMNFQHFTLELERTIKWYWCFYVTCKLVMPCLTIFVMHTDCVLSNYIYKTHRISA